MKTTIKNSLLTLILVLGLAACAIEAGPDRKAAGTTGSERLAALEQDCQDEVSKLALYTGRARLQNMHGICSAISE